MTPNPTKTHDTTSFDAPTILPSGWRGYGHITVGHGQACVEFGGKFQNDAPRE